MTEIEKHPVAHSFRPNRLVVWAVLGAYAIWVGLLFVLVRQSDATLGRIYMALLILHLGIWTLCVLIWNPVLIKRRIASGPGTKNWDWVWMAFFLPTLLAVVVIAVRDVHMRDSAPYLPEIALFLGLVIFLFGWTLLTFASIANPFFEKTVRIQKEHGHHVIDKGPYAYIRHPGYVAFSALLIATPLLLASAWTVLPSVIAVGLLVVRTVLEDRTLQTELPGYREYAERVRFRLIPGVW